MRVDPANASELANIAGEVGKDIEAFLIEQDENPSGG
jgi:hypothetical protein